MKRLFTIIISFICVLAVATEHRYVKWASDILETGEYIVAHETEPGQYALLNCFSESTRLEYIGNRLVVSGINDSVIVCDDAYAFYITGNSGGQYSVRSKRTGLYLHTSRLTNPIWIEYYCNPLYITHVNECAAILLRTNLVTDHSTFLGWNETNGGFFCEYQQPNNSINTTIQMFRRVDGSDGYTEPTNGSVVIKTIRDTTYVRDTVYIPVYNDSISNNVTVYVTVEVDCDGNNGSQTHITSYFVANDVVYNPAHEHLRLYNSNGVLIESSRNDIRMIGKPSDLYIVADSSGGYIKFVH